MKVYEITKAEVKRQFELRLTIFRAWARDGIPWVVHASGVHARDADGEPLLEYFPQRVTHIPKWSSDQHSDLSKEKVFIYEDNIARLGDLRPIGHSTFYLGYHEAHRVEAEKFLGILKQAAELQLAASNKTSQIAQLKLKVSLLERIAKHQEEEARAMRMQVRGEISARRKAERVQINNVRRLESDNEQLKKRLSELTSTLQQIRPLKEVSKKSS